MPLFFALPPVLAVRIMRVLFSLSISWHMGFRTLFTRERTCSMCNIQSSEMHIKAVGNGRSNVEKSYQQPRAHTHPPFHRQPVCDAWIRSIGLVVLYIEEVLLVQVLIVHTEAFNDRQRLIRQVREIICAKIT